MEIKSRKGFTLIELLVAILIIGVLTSISIPMYRRSVEKARAVEAIQTLSDVAKAQHDHFLATNEYAEDFGDLIIESFEGVTGTEHATEFYNYVLEGDRVYAEREIDDGYTLYRVYDDPRFYCEPEESSYCRMLQFEVGDGTHGFQSTSEGNWQSCPRYPCTQSCSRPGAIGYTCEGTYNEDGTFSEKVCDSNGYCVTTNYDKNQKAMAAIQCYKYDEKGKCVVATEQVYDENGRLIASAKCKEGGISETNIKCDTENAQKYLYDEKGNIKAILSCEAIDGSGECKLNGNGKYYAYDKEGHLIGKIDCAKMKEDGTCDSFKAGTAYLYDKDGNKIGEGRCEDWNSDGTCKDAIRDGTMYNYDDKGNLLSSVECVKFTEGKCQDYGKAINQYDEKGNITSTAYCGKWQDDKCTEYKAEESYTYDANGNKISTVACSYDGDGNCTAYKTSNGTGYVYDKDGNLISERQCYNYNADLECVKYANKGTAYAYGDGIKVEGSCDKWNNDGSCAGALYNSQIYNYDDKGNVISVVNCDKYESGKCQSSNNTGVEYIYDKNGNKIAEIGCKKMMSDGYCDTYGYTEQGVVYNYDDKGNLVSSTECYSLTSDGKCNKLDGTSTGYVYDENGNQVAQGPCKTWDETGHCQEINGATTYTYDKDGNITSTATCELYDHGKCENYTGITYNSYDSNGNQTGSVACGKLDPGAGECAHILDSYNYDNNAVYTYDEHGNVTGVSHCSSYDLSGQCINSPSPYTTYSYTYDEQGNMTSSTQTDHDGNQTVCYYGTNPDGTQYQYGCSTTNVQRK